MPAALMPATLMQAALMRAAPMRQRAGAAGTARRGRAMARACAGARAPAIAVDRPRQWRE